jgi:hypothetical protein
MAVRKKKMSPVATTIVGVAILGSGFLAWKFLLKPYLEKRKLRKSMMQPGWDTIDSEFQDVTNTPENQA